MRLFRDLRPPFLRLRRLLLDRAGPGLLGRRRRCGRCGRCLLGLDVLRTRFSDLPVRRCFRRGDLGELLELCRRGAFLRFLT